MRTIWFIDLTGWIGTVLVLAAYLMVSNGKLRPNQFTYQLLNIVGAGGLMINAYFYHSLPSAVVNLAWMAIGLHGLTRRAAT